MSIDTFSLNRQLVECDFAHLLLNRTPGLAAVSVLDMQNAPHLKNPNITSVKKPIKKVDFFRCNFKQRSNAMSGISSVSNTTPTLNQLIQAEMHNPARPTPPSPSQVTQSLSNDPDHDGDKGGSGVNKTA